MRCRNFLKLYLLFSLLIIVNCYDFEKWKLKWWKLEPLHMRCHQRYKVPHKLFDENGNNALQRNLSTQLFGQNLVLKIVPLAIERHFRFSSAKPLVFAFHGPTGCGKSYVARLCAEHLHYLGQDSYFVTHIQGRDYENKDEISEYVKDLKAQLDDAIQRHPRTVFIIEEVDKLHPRLVSVFKPYLEHNRPKKSGDFSQSIFFFLSNRGCELIQKIVSNGARGTLKAEDFEAVRIDAYNYNEQDGGLKDADLIKHNLIDRLIPFFPLEKHHVKQCVRYEFSLYNVRPDEKMVDEIADSFVYDGEYASAGCKHVKNRVMDKLPARPRTEV